MAGPFTGLLDGAGSGFLRPKGQMGDWQHAARTFVDDTYRLAPKSKFLYHVYFSINKSALVHKMLTERHATEIGLLVKSVDLPKFTFKTATVNQYNRKKVVQMSHNLSPLTLRFHDDRNHIVNQLWQSYYMYYYGDPSIGNMAGAYKRNAMKSWSYVPGSYGFDNNSVIPFFDYIMLYQLNKREYVSYKIINPLIQSFNHDTLNSSDQGSNGAECSMTLAYEAVTYDVGSIRSGKVKGFAQEHYDKSPSPLSAAGGGSRSLFGVGGVIEGAADVIGAISNGTAFSSIPDIINTVSTVANTAQNIKGLTKAGIKQEGVGLLTGGALLAAGSAINSLKGTFFPTSNSASGPTASQINLP